MAVPPRWLHCPRKGSLVANIFLPFKTPLSDQYDKDVPEECRFKPEMLFLYLKTLKVKMGLVIDLTNTKRFYSPDEFTSNDMKHQKISCKGHGECPDENSVKVFVTICHRYMQANPNKLIGVHCTHGYNRTGFLICAYLVEKLDWSIEAAYQAFCASRPPGIIKEGYIRELFTRYGSGEDIPPAPILPSWHTESQDEETDDGNRQTYSSYGGGKKIPKKTFIDEMTINHVVQEMDGRVSTQVQMIVKQMCNGHHNGFLGAQPVSMTRENLQLLHRKAYMVSWKADGTRFLMLINGKDNIFMFDRDNVVFKINNLDFPRRKNLNEHVQNTLVDGELIIDEVEGNKIPRFLIYDIIKYEGQEVGKCDFHRRLECIKRELIDPRNEKAARGMLDKTLEPFSVRRKDFWDVLQAPELLDTKFSKMVSHEVDGLIFQPAAVDPVDTYKIGRNDDILKWKPSNMNSVDFRLKITTESGVGILPTLIGYLFVGGMTTPFARLPKVTRQLKQYDNKIIECTFENESWKMMRERTDKSFPNAHKTAVGVCHSIQHPVTKEILFDFIKNQSYNARRRHAHHKMHNQQKGGGAPSSSSTASNPRKRTHDETLMPPPQLPNMRKS